MYDHQRTVKIFKDKGVNAADLVAAYDSSGFKGEIAASVLSAASEFEVAVSLLERACSNVESAVNACKHYIYSGRILNDLGELQGSGPALDVAIASLVRREGELRNTIDLYNLFDGCEN